MRTSTAFAFAARLSAASPALAQPRAPARSTMSDEARGRYEAASRFYALRRFDDAAREFQTVYALSGFAAVLFNAGRAFEDGGHPAEAIAAYEHFLREGSPGVERSAVESRIAALRARPATPPPVVAAPPPPVVIAPPPAVVRPAVAPVTHHPSRALPIGLLVGGGVALAGALTLGATVMSTDGDLAARCPGGQCATSPDDQVASARARALAADVIGLVGVGALAAGVVVWIAQGARPAPSSAGATVSAGCGPGSCGAFVRGAF